MAKAKKESVIGLGMQTGGLGSYGLGTAASKAGVNAMKQASGAKNMAMYHAEKASEHQFNAMEANGSAKHFWKKASTADTGDRAALFSVEESGRANMHLAEQAAYEKDFEHLVGKGQNLKRAGKALKGLGVAGVALGGLVAGVGMVKETKAGYEEARARKAAIRGARK